MIAMCLRKQSLFGWISVAISSAYLILISYVIWDYPFDDFINDVHLIGNNYTLVEQPNILFGNNSTIMIPPEIIAVESDSNFIIIMQNPGGEANRQVVQLYNEGIVFPHGMDYVYYWIIDQCNDSVFGPLTLADFEDKKSELNISLSFIKN